MDNRLTINRYLGAHGLSTLDDPGHLVQQLGFLIEGHDHFRSIINKCEPEFRREMYEALWPHLGFEPKPLDVYIAELGQQAEAQQLPTVDMEGKFHAYRVGEVRGREFEEHLADMLEEQLSKFHLSLTCRACTREETFHGGTKGDAIWKARKAGWTFGVDQRPLDSGANTTAYEICPECPAVRPKN